MPNIVIFNPDQFRADAKGHLGCPAAVTPNLDRICSEDGFFSGVPFARISNIVSQNRTAKLYW